MSTTTPTDTKAALPNTVEAHLRAGHSVEVEDWACTYAALRLDPDGVIRAGAHEVFEFVEDWTTYTCTSCDTQLFTDEIIDYD